MLATHAATQANSTKSVMKKGIAFCISFYPPSSANLKGKRLPFVGRLTGTLAPCYVLVPEDNRLSVVCAIWPKRTIFIGCAAGEWVDGTIFGSCSTKRHYRRRWVLSDWGEGHPRETSVVLFLGSRRR
jgi:hypothetical protein